MEILYSLLLPTRPPGNREVAPAAIKFNMLTSSTETSPGSGKPNIGSYLQENDPQIHSNLQHQKASQMPLKSILRHFLIVSSIILKSRERPS